MSESRGGPEVRSPVEEPLLATPVVCLMLEPRNVEPIRGNGGVSAEELQLRTRLRPQFVPYLITDEKLDRFADEDVEIVDHFGPFTVYKPLGLHGPQDTGWYFDRDEFSFFRNNLTREASLPEMDRSLTDQKKKKPSGPRTEIERMKLAPWEAKLRAREFAHLIDEEIIARVETLQDGDIPHFPRVILRGFNDLAEQLQNADPTMKLFEQNYLQKLIQYTSGEVFDQYYDEESGAFDWDMTTGFDAYERALDLMKGQGEALGAKEKKPRHKGVLIPFTRFAGEPSYTPNASIGIVGQEMIIRNNGEEYHFPMPERRGDAEVCYKGGLARIVAKIALGEDITAELPVKDVDVVIFGENPPSMDFIRDKYETDLRETEKIPTGGYEEYAATRDSVYNEVVVTPDGVFISRNALSSMYQGFTRAAADKTTESLFGKNIFSVYTADLPSKRHLNEEGIPEVPDVVAHMGYERFPSPIALSRMIKLLVDGKTDGIVIPEGVRKMDLGPHWLVNVRKIQGEQDSKVRQAKMERLTALADMLDVRYLRGLSPEERQDPDIFYQRLTKEFPDFDMESRMSDRDTIIWVAHKLKKYLVRSYMQTLGYPSPVERKVQGELVREDMDLELLTIPPLEAYGVASERVIHDVETKQHIQGDRKEVEETMRLQGEYRAFQQSESLADLYMETGEDPYSDELWKKTVDLARGEALFGEGKDGFYGKYDVEELVAVGEKLRAAKSYEEKYRIMAEKASTGELWYDVILGHINDKSFAPVRDDIARQAARRGARFDHIVDVGTGPGNAIKAVAPFADRLTGVDQYAFLLDTAKKEGVPENVTLTVGDATDLPVGNEDVDIVVSNGLTYYLPEPIMKGFIEEVARVLKPGGTFYETYAFREEDDEAVHASYTEYLTSAKAVLVGLLDNVASHNPTEQDNMSYRKVVKVLDDNGLSLDERSEPDENGFFYLRFEKTE